MKNEKQDIPETFQAFVAKDFGSGSIESRPGSWSRENLPDDGVDLEIQYSCLNYKDALSATGNKGVSPNYPHIPGIDAAAVRMDTGEQVLITGFDFGMGTPGGLARYARVPSGWIIPMPDGLDPGTAMAYGTAGVTAGLCVDAVLARGITPSSGPVVVSGATGGVGSIAMSIFSKLGYEVHAVSGKNDKHEWLKERGASKILSRDEFMVKREKPLMRPEYAGAVDTVGGEMLHRILRSLKFSTTAAACGMVGGTELNTNIFPFILRDISLRGIASADTSRERKTEIWNRLAGEWSVDWLAKDAEQITLEQLPDAVKRILAAEVTGRIVVKLED